MNSIPTQRKRLGQERALTSGTFQGNALWQSIFAGVSLGNMGQTKDRSEVLVVSIVDDDDGFRRSLARLLRSFGFRVREYESAREFLASNAASLGDCLIVDVRMPELDGFQLAERLQTMNLQIPTIFVSGNVREGDPERAGELGGGFLEKPFDAKTLREAIERAVKSREDIDI